MNKNWHKDIMKIDTSKQVFDRSYQQMKQDREETKDRRNFVYSGAVVLSLYAIACALGYVASCNKIKPYDIHHNDFTNRLERITR